MEDLAALLVLLAAYRRHESPNGFLRMVADAPADAPHLQALASVSRTVFERCMYPSELASRESYLGPSWNYSLARAAEWAATMLTVEAYLPRAVTAQLSSPQALRENAAPLTVALLITYELATPRAGATLASLCAHADATPLSAGGGVARGALVRHLFSVASLLACDARDELMVAQLRLALLLIERLLDGHASAPLLLSVDLGGGLPLWTYSSGAAALSEYKLASPQPLLAGAHALLGHLLQQNLRRASFHPPLYLQALTLLQRLLVAQQRAGQTLPLLKWEGVWDALFVTADFLAQPDVLAIKGAPEVGLRVLELINVFLTLGDGLLPSHQHLESFAYELIRRRLTFERLYRVAKKVAPRLVDAMALARSLIIGALDAIASMEPSAAASLTAAQALDIVRRLNPTPLKPEAAAALLRPPTQLTPHEQRGLARSRSSASYSRTAGATARSRRCTWRTCSTRPRPSTDGHADGRPAARAPRARVPPTHVSNAPWARSLSSSPGVYRYRWYKARLESGVSAGRFVRSLRDRFYFSSAPGRACRAAAPPANPPRGVIKYAHIIGRSQRRPALYAPPDAASSDPLNLRP